MGCLPLPALALVQPTNAQLTQIGLTGVRVARITGSAKPIAATTTQWQGPRMEPVQKAVCVQPSVFAASTGHLLVGVRALHSVALAAVLWASALLPTPVRILVLGWRADQKTVHAGWWANAKQGAVTTTQHPDQLMASVQARAPAPQSARGLQRGQSVVPAAMRPNAALGVAMRGLARLQTPVLLHPNAPRQQIDQLAVSATIHGSAPRIGVTAIARIIS